MITHSCIQGTDDWKRLRATHFCASEASAVMGVSKYMSRSELLRQKATGYVPEVAPGKQALFDRGHAAEAAARPLVEAHIGDELYPATGTLEVDGLPLLASFDGVNMTGNLLWESKLWNADLAAAIECKRADPHYWAQLEQQLLVSGADLVYFTTTDGTSEKLVGMWYESVPERRAALIAGWQQFAIDLAEYQHVPSAPEPVAEHIDSLPSLLVQIEGRVLATNLDQFKQTALEFIGKINTNLKTDDDFATAEKTAKFCKDAEERLDMVKSAALAQTASIDDLFRTIDSLREELRAKRLTLEKAVKTRKDDIRVEIQGEAKAALVAHVGKLNQMIGKPYMPVIASDFAGVMKGKKTVASLRDAVDTELARCKIEAGDVAQRIITNLNSLRELAADHAFLFADTAQIVLKANDDLVALVKLRIAEHKEAEAKRVERERVAREVEARILEAAKPAVEKAAVAMSAGDAVIIDASNAQEPVRVVPKEEVYSAPQPSRDASVGDALDGIMVNMHIANITRGQAKTIAEYLGGGAVVWQGGMCYPTADCACTVVLAGDKSSTVYTAKG